MEVIAAIVLVCGLNLGKSSINNADVARLIKSKQKCQIEIAKCMQDSSFQNEGMLIKCIAKRK